jgi:hypothetical protein
LATPDKFNLPAGFVPFSRIDWADTAYRMTYHRPIETLIRSIATIGLRQIPVLQEKEAGRYCIVTGYRRLQALKKINPDPVTCIIADPEIEPQDLFLLNFHENLDRGFNVVELSWVVKKMSFWWDEKELIDRYLPLLQLPPRKESIVRQLRVNEISPVFLPALIQGRLFPETVDTIIRDFSSIAHCLLSLFIFLHWGFQKQKEFLSDLKTLGRRFREKPEKILFASPIMTLLQRFQWTPQQKGEALRKWFRRSLFPILTETEKRFEATISALPLDPQTRIHPPPFFEGGQYGLEVRFSNPDELKTALEKISQIIEQGKLDNLP